MLPIGRIVVSCAVCALFLLVFAPASWANNVMPQTLVDVAHANGCDPIDSFFDERDPDIMNPPYVLGWIPGEARESAVFWCKKIEKSDKPYKLLFAAPAAGGFNLADPKQLAGCPAAIEWSSPSGLSIEIQKLDLRDFRPVTNPRQRLEAPGIVSNARVIVNDNGDGLTATFYCYRGQWVFRQLE